MVTFLGSTLIFLGYLFGAIKVVFVILGILCCIKYLKNGK